MDSPVVDARDGDVVREGVGHLHVMQVDVAVVRHYNFVGERVTRTSDVVAVIFRYPDFLVNRWCWAGGRSG